MAAIMRSGMSAHLALHPCCLFGFAAQFLRLAELDSLLFCETLRAFGNKHHVRTIFENLARKLNGILNALQRGRGAGAKCRPVHDDGVALDTAIQIEMRAVARVEN